MEMLNLTLVMLPYFLLLAFMIGCMIHEIAVNIVISIQTKNYKFITNFIAITILAMLVGNFLGDLYVK